jgi:hypothetical protein
MPTTSCAAACWVAVAAGAAAACALAAAPLAAINIAIAATAAKLASLGSAFKPYAVRCVFILENAFLRIVCACQRHSPAVIS